MRADEMEQRLDKFARDRGFKVVSPRYVTEDVDVTAPDGRRIYSETSMDWCVDCAEAVVAAARAELPEERAELVQVEFADAMDHDSPPTCAECARPLDGVLNESGVGYELVHFLDQAVLGALSPDDAFAVARVLESAPDNREALALGEWARWLADNGYEKGVAEAPNDLKGVRLGPWTPIDGGHCCTRTVEGGDPENVDDRVAFIEKTPRVLHNGEWVSGPKGSGGSGDAAEQGFYGFDPDSRAWADAFLRVRGAGLTPEPEPQARATP